MKKTITVIVTAPDGTEGIADAVTYALDWPDHYPDDVDTSDWGVSVYDLDAFVSPDAITRIAGLLASMAGESAMIREALENEMPGGVVGTGTIEAFIRDGAA